MESIRNIIHNFNYNNAYDYFFSNGNFSLKLVLIVIICLFLLLKYITNSLIWLFSFITQIGMTLLQSTWHYAQSPLSAKCSLFLQWIRKQGTILIMILACIMLCKDTRRQTGNRTQFIYKYIQIVSNSVTIGRSKIDGKMA